MSTNLLDQLSGGEEIGKVYGKGDFAYYVINGEGGPRGPVSTFDGMALIARSLEPLMNTQKVEDRWTVRLRRAAYGSLAIAGLTLSIVSFMAIDAINKANSLREEVQTKWSQQIEPRIDDAMQRYDDAKPALDQGRQNLDDLNRRYDETVTPGLDKLDEFKAEVEKLGNLVDKLNPFN
jgi:hypothetical protein